jgi:ABC-type polysaccharide/polyol phosphate export permease
MIQPVLGPRPAERLNEVPGALRARKSSPAMREIIGALTAVHIWGPIALDDVLARYKRTVVGPFWVIIPQAAFIFGLYTLHRHDLGGGSPDFLVYLAISLPLWSLMTAAVVDTTGSLVAAKGFIESYALPPALHIVRTIARSYIVFAHLLVIYFLVALWVDKTLPVTLIAAIPALAIIAIFGLGAGFALAPLGARFRDVAPAMQAVMMLGFVLTPVFWVPSEAQLRSPLVALNPFLYLLEVVRQPMLGRWGELYVWVDALLISLVALVVGMGIYASQRRMIPYWL